jgi:prevent-host-death family protein
MGKHLTSTEAVRRFGEILSEVRHGGGELVITQAGKPVASVVPCESRTSTLREFANFWRVAGEPDDTFADDLERVQRADSPVQL